MGFTKGGTEKNETIEETAMREVEEETGVTGLAITENCKEPIIYSKETVVTN